MYITYIYIRFSFYKLFKNCFLCGVCEKGHLDLLSAHLEYTPKAPTKHKAMA